MIKPERNEEGRERRDEKQRIMGQPFGEGVPFGDVRAMRDAGGWIEFAKIEIQANVLDVN